MAVSIADLVNQIERDLLVHYTRPIYDTPSVSYNDSIASVQLASTDTLGRGALLDANFEMMYVTAFNEGTRTASVIRGFLGTPKAGGDGSTLVRINPRFPTVSLLDTITDELRSWDERLFVVELEALSFGASDTSVEITPSRQPYKVVYARPRPDEGAVRKFKNVSIRRSENTGQFSTGYSLHIGAPFGEATTLDVGYALPFDLSALSSSSDLLATHGLTAGMLEILKWGALYRMVAGKEAARLDPQTHARPDVEQSIPATALLQASAQYRAMRDVAFDREVRRLLAEWPYRFGS